MSDKPAKRALVDWERVEREYRAGVLSLREIGLANGCSHVAVAKKAKALNWSRDLNAKIQIKAEALVNKAAVTKEVTASRLVHETEVVEANALAITNIRLGHRSDIAKGRRLVMELLDELQDQTSSRELLAQLGDMLRSEDDKGVDKRNDLYMAVISLPERTKTAKALTEAMKNLFAMEREAWNIVAGPDKKPDEVENLSDEELDAKIEASLGRIKPTRAS